MKKKNGILIYLFFVIAVFLITATSCKKDEVNKSSLILLAEGSVPAWSPDGRKIAFLGKEGLFTMNSDGTNKQLLIPEEIERPIWSPSGTYIIYRSYSLLGNLCRINADGSNKVNLTNNSVLAYVPSWSPNENQIAFVGSTGELYLMNNDGQDIHNLTTNLSSVSPYQTPDWSPDGGTIMFSSGFDNERDIYLLDSNGSNLRRLVIDSLFEADAQLSLDGTTIYFSGSGSVGSAIYRVNSDGTGIINLTGTIGILNPRLSPDGSKIVFTSFRDGEDYLYIISADGSNLQILSRSAVYDMEWSPDSHKVVFVVFQDGISSIYSISIPD